ncbi:molybdenum cofactor biosysynthesis protein [Phragmitibacter flavus]|uniref:Molybdenum cofactor biosysynthesis protein n=1 Tax=Phragmitibacter flavus TaxID=2576071 RepID=A0A5R8KBK3_9BACT|nr:MOSC domain-containing protein [Phragmitibacter flavus]TLD69637.1 molybdenum cofactor biosysynthesis protein [Phragmitibacter flavus]
MTIEHLYISPAHNYFGHHGQPAGDTPMVEVDQIELIAGKGIIGDRFFDYKENYKGQVTFFSMETYERLCHQFSIHDHPPSVFRRNILVRGIDLNHLIGREFDVQGITFQGTEEAKPCYWMNQAFADGTESALRGHGGLRARILTDGVLRSKI